MNRWYVLKVEPADGYADKHTVLDYGYKTRERAENAARDMNRTAIHYVSADRYEVVSQTDLDDARENR